MRYLKYFEDRNHLRVSRSNHEGGWNCQYVSELGSGRALVFDTGKVSGIDGMFLFGISTNPQNSGIGRKFLREIFDYFGIDEIYLTSSDDHPVWNKIAKKLGKMEIGGKEMTLYLLKLDNSDDMIIEKSLGSEGIRQKWYSDIDKSIFYKLVNIDPTSVRKKDFSKPGKYSKWLIMNFKKGNLTHELLEDSDYVKRLNYYLFIFSTGWYKAKTREVYYEYPNSDKNDYLTRVEHTKYNDNDIMKFSISGFISKMGGISEQYDIETEKAKFDTVYSDDKLDILVPLNFTASRKTAENTQWCSQSSKGYSVWNKWSILFRIVPKSLNLDKVKLTWRSDDWFMASQKYPEIMNREERGPWKPFDKVGDREVWQELVDKNDTNREHWDKLRNTMNLVSDRAKEMITQYWEKNIEKKR